ncbi:hypothetical protein SCUP515_12969 [Seiridium cupressi]
MLRLRSQAIRRLGIPYTCPACLPTTRAPATAGLYYTTAARQSVHTSATQTAKDANNAKTAVKDKSSSSVKPSGETPSKPPQSTSKPHYKSKKAKKTRKAEKTAPPSANDSQHQLKVLQGAIAALKNVLGQQNIKVDDMKKSGDRRERRKKLQPEQPESATQKTPAPVAPEIQTDTAKLRREKYQPKKPPRITKRALKTLKTELAEHVREPESVGKSAGPKPKAPLKKSSSSKPVNAVVGAAFVKHFAKHGDSQAESPKSETSVAGPGSQSTIGQALIDRPSSPYISKIDPEELQMVPIEKPQPPVPAVSYGLERVLFNPGVYHLQDPRSKVFNFDPYLANIMPINEFDFNALQQYVTSSKDVTLIDVARENGKKYTGSTSSMTSMLSHFHYLLSNWREINSGMTSKQFQVPSGQFTQILRSPAATFLHWKDGVYAIDADKEFDTASILSMLGKSMEKLLTLPTEEYEKYRRGNSHQISEEERNAAEAYHYTGLGDFMMRSQLDAHDPRIPGTGMFDLKTRAVVSIRMDAQGFEKGLGYELRHRHGNWESYEREYHDMIRAAFLKYSLQVRMGRMDGIFVAFHNTERIFGFQYIPLEEMDFSLHGTSDLTLGDKEFKLSLALLNKLINRATEKFPEKSLRLFIETRTSKRTPFMYAFVKPVEPGEIEAVQNANKASVEEFERTMLGLKNSMTSESALDAEGGLEEKANETEQELDLSETQEADELQEHEDSTASWDEIQVMVEDAMEDEELGVGAVRQAIEDALEESGLLEEQSPEEARGYVDALLSAVTGGSVQPPSPIADGVEDEGAVVSSEEEDTPSLEVDGTVLKSDQEDGDHLLAEEPVNLTGDGGLDEAVQTTDQPQHLDASATLQTGSVRQDSPLADEQAEDESELEEDDTQEEVATNTSMSTLSNLILRMTRRIDEKGHVEKQRDADVSSKLQEFERVLSKIISESREDEPETSESNTVGRPVETAGDLDSARNGTTTPSTDGVPDTATSPLAAASETEAEPDAKPQDSDPILGMVLTVRNRVNDKYVERPENLTKSDRWEIEYNIEELSDERAHRLFVMCKKRRERALSSSRRDSAWNEMFDGALPKYSNEGRKFRKEEERLAKERPVHILGEQHPKSYDEVFGRRT